MREDKILLRARFDEKLKTYWYILRNAAKLLNPRIYVGPPGLAEVC